MSVKYYRKPSDKNDVVNHPKHYKSKSGLETIDVIDAFTDGLEGYEAAYTANILKYTCRWKEKNGVEDLKKARWYLDRLITRLEANEGDRFTMLFETRTHAEEVLDQIEEMYKYYGSVSLADIYDFFGYIIPDDAVDKVWRGENPFNGAAIKRHAGNSYVLVLPMYETI